jgi:transposase InsO family protein
MAGEAAPVHVRLLAAVSGDLAEVKVSDLCRELGVSRKTFYKWADRYQTEGLAGLEPRSRRPVSSPGQVPVEVEDRIVELRKQLDDDGLDAGADTIHAHLVRAGGPCPSRSTIWRVLVRRGQVVPEPKKRPRSSWQRFEASQPNECWQIDATEWELRNGRRVEIFDLLDDHSRLMVASVAVPAATTVAAWAAFSGGVERYGLPLRCLSDNGLCFSGRLKGMEVTFEVNLRAAGITPINSRPYHPQTCGKVERVQQTLKKWLRARPRARSIRALQTPPDQTIEAWRKVEALQRKTEELEKKLETLEKKR